jgi:simple sugar transport system permease protein
VNAIGLPTLIIAVFWIILLITGTVLGISLSTLISDTLKRAGMNGILVLAMVPSIQSGTGPNFALPIGIVCGLFALITSIELGFTGMTWFVVAVSFAAVLAAFVGYLYGKLLNAVKGSEMTIATYTGFSIAAFMCLIWLMIPYSHPNMQWFMGTGLRETIQLDAIGAAQILNNYLSFKVAGVFVPTGLILVFLFFCLLVWIHSKSKQGISISAGGISPRFSLASGVDINKNRIVANIISTVLGAIGIIVYSQSYGYAQLYNAPLMMAFPAVAAILIGGATASKAKVSNVIIGVFLFQGLLTTALPVANLVFVGTDLSEIMRMVIQNGIILYALTQVKGGDR